MTSDITIIPYSDYLEHLKKASSEGITSSEIKYLRGVFPNIMEQQHDLLYNEIASLMNVLIKSTFKHFERRLNECLTEGDSDILLYGIRDFKRNIDSCLFFMSMDIYPESIKKNLGNEVVGKFTEFLKEIDSYMVRLLRASPNNFVEDLRYLLKRAKLQKYISGFEYKSSNQ